MRKQLLKKTAASVLSLAMIVSSMTFTSLKMSKDVTAAPTTSSKMVWSDEFNGEHCISEPRKSLMAE